MKRRSSIQPVRPTSAIPDCDISNSCSDFDSFFDQDHLKKALPGEVHWIRLGPWWSNGSVLFSVVEDEFASVLKWVRRQKLHIHLECHHDAVRIQALKCPYRKLAHWHELLPGQTMQLKLSAACEDLEKALMRAQYLRAKYGFKFEPFMAGHGLYLTRNDDAETIVTEPSIPLPHL